MKGLSSQRADAKTNSAFSEGLHGLLKREKQVMQQKLWTVTDAAESSERFERGNCF